MSDIADRPLRLGMVGGGQDAFIGGVHRIASRMDGHFQLVAGALSSTPERALRSGQALGLANERIYASFEEMATREAARADGIEAVSIVTPNHLHFAAARAFLAAGIHVFCDKPMTSTLEDAIELSRLVNSGSALFFLTHNYVGYPLVREAREIVRRGDLGALRVVQATYAQSWLTSAVEEEGSKQAGWRTDPAFSGMGGSIGDIGTHAFHLLSYVTGLSACELAADLHRFVAGRRLDDNAHILLRFVGGARGMLWASQVAPGCENDLSLRVYGEEGGLEWSQEDPNRLWVTRHGEARRLLTRGGPGTGAAAAAATRVPAGHPEGYLEGFANLYADAAQAIRAHATGASGGPGASGASGELAASEQSGAAAKAVREASPTPERDAPRQRDTSLPGVEDGVLGLRFLDACVRSSAADGRFVPMNTDA